MMSAMTARSAASGGGPIFEYQPPSVVCDQAKDSAQSPAPLE
jgi:hypothetical protein